MPETAKPIDYRALIQDRKQKQTRPIFRHVICLVPSLFAELEELRSQERAERRANNGELGGGDTRLGVPNIAKQVAALEERIAEVSVVGVFKAPTAAHQEELSRRLEDESPIATVTESILDSFTHFERNREPIPAEQLGRTDLADLLPEMAQGELLALGNRIIEASAGAPDLPLSVRKSLLSQTSGGISKPR